MALAGEPDNSQVTNYIQRVVMAAGGEIRGVGGARGCNVKRNA